MGCSGWGGELPEEVELNLRIGLIIIRGYRQMKGAETYREKACM